MVYYVAGEASVEVWLSTEAKGRNALVAIVVRKDVPDTFKRQLILVELCRVHVVEGSLSSGHSIGACEVHRNYEVKLKSSSEVVDEVGQSLHLKPFESQLSRLLLLGVLHYDFSGEL